MHQLWNSLKFIVFILELYYLSMSITITFFYPIFAKHAANNDS